MTPEQEQALIKAAEQIETFLKNLSVGLELKDSDRRRWYTAQALTLRVLKISAHIAPVEMQLVLGCLHGCIDLFGFSGTLKLGLQLRKTLKKKGK